MNLTHPAAIALLEPDLPSIDRIVPYISRVLDSGRFSNFGPMVVALESRLAQSFYAEATDAVCCVTTSSGTTAIETALLAAQLPARSQVLLPAFGFPAAVLAVARLGHVPLLAAVDEETWHLTPETAAAIVAATPVAAVVPVASLGYVQDAAEWSRFSVRHRLPVIIDAAAALGNQSASSGTLVVSSMHATKALGIGEGGIIATTDSDLARRLRALTNFGFDDRLVTMVGGNAKLSEWHAAIAHAQLDRWDQIRSRRRAVRDRYRECLDGVPVIFHPDTWTVPVPAFMPVRMRSVRAAERLIQALAADSIGARRWFWPALPDHPALANLSVWNVQEDPLPAVRALAGSLVFLPFHTRLQPADIARIAHVVRHVANTHEHD